MGFSWDKQVKKAQLLFKRRKRGHLKHGDSANAKNEDRRIT